jgi:ArsR family transcriptional regulator
MRANQPLGRVDPVACDSVLDLTHCDRALYIVYWLSVDMRIDLGLRALANSKRLQILHWLKKPRKYFPPQVDGDLVEDGVCGVLIAAKLRISQPTASEHLRILSHAGLIRSTRIKKWTFYKRDERRIKAMKTVIAKQV